MQNKINVGLIGAGTVGSGTYKILKENFNEIYRKTGKEIVVFALAEKDTKRAKEVVDDKTLIFDDAFDLVRDENIHIVVELIGGTGISKDLVAEALKNNGAAKVVAYATHAVLSGNAINNLNKSKLDELVVTNSIPLSDEAQQCAVIRVLPLGPLLAETVRRISNEESISAMFL